MKSSDFETILKFLTFENIFMAFIFSSQEGKSIEMEKKSQNAQSSTTKITSSKSSSSTIVSPSTSPKISAISKISSESSLSSSSSSSSSASASSTTSTSTTSSEAKDAPGDMYDSIEYEYNALPIKDTGEQPPDPDSEPPVLPEEQQAVDSQQFDEAINEGAEELKKREADEDGEEESELENPGDYYLNEGDEDESTTNSKNLLDSPSLTSIFFDIPDPGSFPPGTRLKYQLENILK